jgi:cytochrome d ubiquinol oxidase subunit I
LLLWRGRLFETRWLLWVFVFAVGAAVLANQLGWVAAEVGRQPWIVHPPVEWTADGDVAVGASGAVEYDEGQGLRTLDAVSPGLEGRQVLGSIVGFSLVYLALAAVWLFVLDQKIRHGPEPAAPAAAPHTEGLAAAVARHPEDHLTGPGEAGA